AIVVNGILIERWHLSRLMKLGLPEGGDPIGVELAHTWGAIQRQARLNFVLIMIVVALGETLRVAKMGGHANALGFDPCANIRGDDRDLAGDYSTRLGTSWRFGD